MMGPGPVPPTIPLPQPAQLSRTVYGLNNPLAQRALFGEPLASQSLSTPFLSRTL